MWWKIEPVKQIYINSISPTAHLRWSNFHLFYSVHYDRRYKQGYRFAHRGSRLSVFFFNHSMKISIFLHDDAQLVKGRKIVAFISSLQVCFSFTILCFLSIWPCLRNQWVTPLRPHFCVTQSDLNTFSGPSLACYTWWNCAVFH